MSFLFLTTFTAFTVAAGLTAGAFVGRRRRFPRWLRLSLLGAAFVAVMAPVLLWAWQKSAASPALSRAEQITATYYNGEYGGLTVYHSFGEGKSKYNAPDILEAGGFIRDVTYTSDGTAVESFWIHTLQGKRFKFLIRPEIVPINTEIWDVEHFQVYSLCRCMVALHFTKQPFGNVAIILFAVEFGDLG